MSAYDALAEGYDGHFTRPVDRWEDERLAALLRPLVNGRAVLDLGCGTGWVLDHTAPLRYVGLDSSSQMLWQLGRKHPAVTVVKAEVGSKTWLASVPGNAQAFDAVVCTWALQYLRDEPDQFGWMRLLADCCTLIRPGGVIALHGYLPRYVHRRHEICGDGLRTPVVVPKWIVQASRLNGMGEPKLYGTGALPDGLAWMGRAVWHWAWAAIPDGHHYAGLWVWRR